MIYKYPLSDSSIKIRSLELSLLENYYKKGHYLAEIHKKADLIWDFIVKRKQKNKYEAIVLDIDDTALHTPWELLSPLNPFVEKEWVDCLLEAKTEPVQPILALYQKVLNEGIKVFFLSGRGTEWKSYTERNLERAGFDLWEGLFLFSKEKAKGSIESKPLDVVCYKAGVRKELIEKGYKIICNIGDQRSDLEGGFAEKIFRLPNPFYTVL